MLGQLQRWCRRQPALAALIAAVVLLLLLTALGSMLVTVHFGRTADRERHLREGLESRLYFHHIKMAQHEF